MAQITTIHAGTEHAKTLLRMAAYARTSSDSCDQQHSYAAQVKYYTEYIGSRPEWVLTEIYADEGLTGTSADQREEFQRMLTDCKRGKIDRILVKSVSRFARNTSDCLTAIRLLKSLGVTVLFQKENLDTANMGDEFILTMHGMAAQDESLTISGNVRWAARKRMANGTFLPGHTAYGYRLQGREYVVHEPEAVIVRKIFSWFLIGMGKQAIVNRLNREHPEKRWYIAGVSYILCNPHYIGDVLFQRKFSTGTLPYRELKNEGQLPQYYVEGYNIPIISAEDYQAAQRLQKQRETKGHGSEVRHLLSRKLYCACGSLFRRKIIGDEVYWECRRHNNSTDSCPMLEIPESLVFAAFIALINKLTAHRAYILTPMLSQLEQMQARYSGTRQKVYDVDKKIAALNDQSHTVARLHNKGILDSSDFAAQTGRVTQQVNALRAERRRLLHEDENNDALADLRALDEAIDMIEETQTIFDEDLFAEIVEDITMVSPTKLRFRLLGGPELTETIERRGRRSS